jgi:iron complex outermembrane receptor protein
MTRNFTRRGQRAAWLASAAIVVGAGQAAWAADAPSASVAEVTVTAQKREERLQDVPVSVAVVSSQTLSAQKFSNATDLQYLVPGLQVSNSAGPRSFGFYIRGIGTNSFSSESIEGSVAYVLDGVVLGQAGASLSDLPDIDHIEVLRGPQGTLFGKNASAGVINIVTKNPSKLLTGGGSISYAHPDNEVKGNAWISGPITEDLGFLVSVRGARRDGIVENLYDGRRLNDENNWGLRGKLRWQPSDRLTFTATADYWERKADCCIWTLRTVNPVPSALELTGINAGIKPGPENEQQYINGPVFSNVISNGVSGEADYDLGGGYTLTSITGARRWHTVDGLDSDNSPLNVFDQNYANFNQKQLSEELRITSPTGHFVDYVAGLYFFGSDVLSRSYQRNTTSTAAYVNRVVTNDATTRNYAVFGQANLNFTDKLRGILGARLIQERATAEKVRVDPVNTALPAQDAVAAKTQRGDVWRVGLQYQFTPDVMGFVTATRGYKAGGFDTNIGFAELRDVKPEIPTSYEIGVRSEWLDHRLLVNLTAFDEHIRNYQVSSKDANLNIYYISNAARVKTRGVELQAVAQPLPTPDLTMNFSAAYVDAYWGSFTNAACYTGQTVAEGCVGNPGTRDITGQTLPRSPKWSLNLGGHYDRALTDELRLFVDADGHYQSDANVAFPTSPFTVQPGYTMLNAAVGIGPADKRWKASIFAKNLGDSHFVAGMLSTPNGKAPLNYSQYPVYESRRIVGVALDTSF